MEALPCTIAIEKFPATELTSLREDLLQSGLDSRHVAELVCGFLAERGYGVSHDDAHIVAESAGVLLGSLQRMQETLEKVAVSM
jgi:hypothetical protein